MKILSILTVASSLLLLAAMNTITIPHIQTFSGNLPILDLRFGGYSLDEVFDLLHMLRAEGRDYYLHRQLLLDFIYPVLFATGYSLAIHQLSVTAPSYLKKLKWPGILHCILGGGFDLIENTCTWIALREFPHLSSSLVNIGSLATQLKFLLSTLGLTIFFILLGSQLWSKLKLKSL